MDDAPAYVKHRALRGKYLLHRVPDVLLIGERAWLITGKTHFHRVEQSGLFRCDILGHVNHYRPGAAGAREIKGLMHNLGQLSHIAHHVVVLGARARDADCVYLLEGIRSNHLAWDLPGNDDQRGRVHVSIRNPRDGIGCAGPGSYQDHSNFTGRLAVAFRHVHCALLMPRQHMAQAWTDLGQLVVDVKHSAARISKDRVYTFPDERLQYDAG